MRVNKTDFKITHNDGYSTIYTAHEMRHEIECGVNIFKLHAVHMDDYEKTDFCEWLVEFDLIKDKQKKGKADE